MKNNFFEINSVAIIGASKKEGKVGNDIMKNLESFKGKKYGVNPSFSSSGTGYEGENNVIMVQKISELQEIPDIAIIVIPATYVLESLEKLGKLGVKRVIIISAGFKEVGNNESEKTVIELGKKYSMRILGPNCLGYIDTHTQLNLSFGGGEIKSGKIALISQSGAMAVALIDMAISTNIGFSKIISMGNKSDIDENDLLRELEKDKKTHIIIMYLESIIEGKKFFEICSRITKTKPIVLVKSGTSKRGGAAANSHTGAISGENEVLQLALKEAGIIVTSSLEELFMFGQALSKKEENIQLTIPSHLAIITNAGGPGVMATDWTEIYNLPMADFNENEKSILMKNMPKSASVANPIDIIGDAKSDRYKQILSNIAQLPQKNTLLIMLTPQKSTDVEEIANIIVDFEKLHPDIFIMVSFIGGEGVKKGRKILQKNNILQFNFPQKALNVLRILKQHHTISPQEKIEKTQSFTPSQEENLAHIKKELSQESKLCSSNLTTKILQHFKINSLEEKLFSQENIQLDFSEKIKYIAKIASPDIPHKTDVGGIVFNISSQEDAKKAYNTILKNVLSKEAKAHISGVTFSRQLNVHTFKEIFIGMKRDPSFGDVLIVGLGGIYVNIFEDVQMALAPISKEKIISLFKNLKSTPLLTGYRGEAGVDFELLAEQVYKIQILFSQLPEIKEIDINPLFAHKKEAIIVDAKFYL